MRAQGTAVLLPFGTVHSPSAAAALAHRSVFESVWARVGASLTRTSRSVKSTAVPRTSSITSSQHGPRA